VKRCKKCGSEPARRETADLSGSSSGRRGVKNEVRITVRSFPCLTCDCGAERRFLYPDFGAKYRPHLSEDLPHAERSLFGKPCCSGCDERLSAAEPTPEAFELRIDLEKAGPITTELVVPAVRCAACGKTQALFDRQLDSDISEALIAAMDGQAIRP